MNSKNVLVTGAASGIGKATAIRFAKAGYNVMMNDTNENGLHSLLPSLPPANHLMLPGSFALTSTIKKGEALIKSNWQELHVLVNCAGLFQKSDPIHHDLTEWRKLFDMLVDGCVLTSQLAAKFMNKGGRIIHVTSIHGTRVEIGASSYSSAKAAINQFCRSLAVELAPSNILVNAIAPGFVNTPMSVVEGINELESEWFKKKYLEMQHLPLRRAAEPTEIAGVALFLAGDDASYITGQVINVDGGLSITF